MLYSGHTHCAACGAKWIENRITMRQVGADFSDMYLGFDTKFVRTFVDLFAKPEAVINGYIKGRRVNYMDAVRYTLLALFITGIYMFFMRSSGALDQYMADFQEGYAQIGTTEENLKAFKTQKKMSEFFLDYLGLITLLTIPLLAFVGRMTFYGKRYFNFTEHIVFYLYTYAHITIATTPLSLPLLWISPEIFTYWSFVPFPAMLFYNAYCYKRCFNLDIQTTILKTLIAMVLLIISLIIIMFLAILLGFLAALLADKMGYDVKGFFEANFA